MAQLFEPTQEQRDGWAQWLGERPTHVKAIAEKMPPWELQHLKTTG